MFSFYVDIASKRTKSKIQLSEEEAIHNLCELAKCFGEDDPQIDTTLLVLSNEILHDVFSLFCNGKQEQAIRKVSELEQVRNIYGSPPVKDFLTFHISRLFTFGFCSAGSWLKAVRAANIAISRCPMVNEIRAQGLVDVLIMLSIAYAALNKQDDAIHSAKIAVDVAQEQADILHRQRHTPLPRGTKKDSRTPLGPMLSVMAIVPVAYFNLATLLRNGDAMEAALAWYERAYLAAEKSSLEGNVVAVFETALRDLQQYAGGNVGGGNELRPGVTVSSDSRDNELSMPQLSADDGHPISHMYRYRSSEGEVLQSNPEYDSLGAGPTRDGATAVDSYSHPSRDVDGRSRSNGRNRTQSHMLPRTSSTGTVYGNEVRIQDGAPVSSRRISSEDEIVFVAGGSNRQRPKSAVSKLGGGYDAAVPLNVENKAPRESNTRDDDDSSRLVSSVFTLGGVVPERLHKMPTSGAQTSGSAVEGDQDLTAVRDTLSRQLMSLIQQRLNIDVQKEQLHDEERAMHALQHRQAVAAIRLAKSNEIKMLVEMGFERQCCNEDRLGAFESMLRAQYFQVNFGPSETPGDRYFEGMIVDVKRSLKANSERDRSVIVRCRVNGTFDAEIIQTGELLINIHASLIRVPPPPEEVNISAENGHHSSSYASQLKKDEVVYLENQRVQCRATIGMKWFTGYIEKAYGRGMYKVEYLDGSFEDNVAAKRLRVCSGKEHSQCASFEYSGPSLLRVGPDEGRGKMTDEGSDLYLVHPEIFYIGQQVLMRFVHGVKWRLGTVMKVREGGHAYDILLAGRQEVEKGVQANCVRHMASLLYGYGTEPATGKQVDRMVPVSPTMTPGSSSYAMVSPGGGRLRTSTSAENGVRVRSGKKNPLSSPSARAWAGNKQDRIGKSHVQSETRTVDSDVNTMLPPAQSANQGRDIHQGTSAIALRDRYALEMHRGAAMLNASAAERKLARAMRQERIRQSSVTKIQALVRGCLARIGFRSRQNLAARQSLVSVEEAELIKRENELLDRYSHALSMAVSREVMVKTTPVAVHETDIPPPGQSDSLARLSDENIGKKLDCISDAIIGERNQHTMDIEKMRNDLVALHERQLAMQRKELEGVLEREMRTLGQTVVDAVKNNASATHVPSSTTYGCADMEQVVDAAAGKIEAAPRVHTPLLADQSTETDELRHHPSRQEDEEVIPCYKEELTYCSDVAQHTLSIERLKDMYLTLWGDCTTYPIEVVSVVASATVEYAILESELDNEVLPATHALNDGDEYKHEHRILFVKDASLDPLYHLKIRVDNASGKSCKLNIPGNKINSICESRKSANVALNDHLKFEICASSLRIDVLAEQMETLWNAHVAWASQSVLISIAIHKNLQNIVRHYLTNAAPCITKPPQASVSMGNELTSVLSSVGWISEKFVLLSDLFSVRQQRAEAKDHYNSTVLSALNDMRYALSKWGYFPNKYGAADGDPDEDCTAVVMAFSNGLSDLASNIMTPFSDYISFGGAVSDGPLDLKHFTEVLSAKYQCNFSVNRILQRQFMDFAASLNIAPTFEKLMLSPLMQRCHQILVHAFAYPEMFNWTDWCRQNMEWVANTMGHHHAEGIDPAIITAVTDEFRRIVGTAEAKLFTQPVESPDLSDNELFHDIEKFCGNLIALSSDVREENV